MYALLLLLGTIAACITLAPGLQNALKKVGFHDLIEISQNIIFLYIIALLYDLNYYCIIIVYYITIE